MIKFITILTSLSVKGDCWPLFGFSLLYSERICTDPGIDLPFKPQHYTSFLLVVFPQNFAGNLNLLAVLFTYQF